VLYNSGYKHYTKYLHQKQVLTTYEDILHAYLYIFKECQQYQNILILEDDVIFSSNLTQKRIVHDINKFILQNEPHCYALGCLPIIVNPFSIISKHVDVLMSGCSHACIYSRDCRQKILSCIYAYQYKLDIDHIKNRIITHKHMYYKPLCLQCFPETHNKQVWAQGMPFVAMNIIKWGMFLLKQLKLDQVVNIDKNTNNFYNIVYTVHYVLLWCILFLLY
jgi:hypothetical protein